MASRAHQRATLDFGDLQFEKGYVAQTAYAKSKLANVLFTRELARRLAGTGVTVNALHPGFVQTRIGDSVGGWRSVAFRLLKRFQALPLEKGADTPVYLASSPEVEGVTGEYFSECRITTPSAAAQDDDAAKQLWDYSAKLTGVG